MKKIYLLVILILVSTVNADLMDLPFNPYVKPRAEDCSQAEDEEKCKLANLVNSYDYDYNHGNMDFIGGSYSLIDENDDGKYDLLPIEINMQGRIEGDYTFYLTLSQGDEYLPFEQKEKIVKGENKIIFDFPVKVFRSKSYVMTLEGRDETGLTILRKYEFNTINIDPDINIESPPFTVDVLSHEYVSTDDDPEYELLQINTLYNVEKEGQYTIKVWMAGGGSSIYSLKETSLEKGEQEIPITFDTRDIVKRHWDKPRIWGIWTDLGDMRYEDLPDYLIEDFDSDKVEKGTMITGPYSSKTVDEDDNGLMDSLIIDMGVYSEEEGEYEIQAQLYNMYKNRVKAMSSDISLKKDQQTVPLEFKGTGIYSSGLNGPYLLREATLFKDGKAVDSVWEPMTTKEYYYDVFEFGHYLNITELKIVDNEVIMQIENTGKEYAFSSFVSLFDQDLNKIEELWVDYIPVGESREIKVDLEDKKPTRVTSTVEYLDGFQIAVKTLEIKREVKVEEGKTKVEITLNPKNELNDVNYYEEIPKCIVEFVGEDQGIIFDNPDFSVVKDDSIVVWAFSTLNNPIKFGYEVDKEVSEDCTNQLKGEASAGEVGKKIQKQPLLSPGPDTEPEELQAEKKKTGTNSKGTLLKKKSTWIIIMIVAVPLIALAFLYHVITIKKKEKAWKRYREQLQQYNQQQMQRRH